MKGKFEKKLNQFQKDAKIVFGIKFQFVPDEVYRKWIDEASKEFPMKDKKGKRVWDSKTSTQGNILLDIMTWFEKWFGDEK